LDPDHRLDRPDIRPVHTAGAPLPDRQHPRPPAARFRAPGHCPGRGADRPGAAAPGPVDAAGGDGLHVPGERLHPHPPDLPAGDGQRRRQPGPPPTVLRASAATTGQLPRPHLDDRPEPEVLHRHRHGPAGPYALRRFDERLEIHRDLNVRTMILGQALARATALITNAAQVAVLIGGGLIVIVSAGRDLSPGGLMAFYVLLLRLYLPAASF